MYLYVLPLQSSTMNQLIQTTLTFAIGLVALVHVFKLFNGKSKKACCTKISQNQKNNLKQSQPIFFIKKHK